MVFQVEKITTPESRAEFASFGFKRPGTNEPSNANDWIVDRDRGVFIASLGGGAFDRPNFFELATSDGVRASIEARVEIEGTPTPRGLEVWWKVGAIRLPADRADSARHVREWVEEALTQFGYLGETQYSNRVHVEIEATALAGVRP